MKIHFSIFWFSRRSVAVRLFASDSKEVKSLDWYVHIRYYSYTCDVYTFCFSGWA